MNPVGMLLSQVRHGSARFNSWWRGVILLVAVLAAGIAQARDPTATVLYSFCAETSCVDGRSPHADLNMDSSGNLYGVTAGGGAHGGGTVFQMVPNATKKHWTQKVLYSFCAETNCADGEAPYREALIMDSSGNLYGTTYDGGANGGGTVFQLVPNKTKKNWTLNILYSFCPGTNCADGQRPEAGLIMDSSGNLYGTTQRGGTALDGTVFQLAPNATKKHWTYNRLYNFCAETDCADGEESDAGLVMDSSGILYGVTSGGGANNGGAVFQLAPSATRKHWTYTVLYSFCAKTNCADGGSPTAGLIMDSSGTLYGVTAVGGANNGGTAFQLVPNATKKKWTQKVLYGFCAKTNCADGETPTASLIMDRSGNLYGTAEAGGANNGGTVFQLVQNATTNKWKHKVLYSFCAKTNCADGEEPDAGLIMDRSGNLYGTTEEGGPNGLTDGTVFEIKNK